MFRLLIRILRTIRRECIATIAKTAVITPESSIENLSGIPGNIIIGQSTVVRGRLLTYKHGGRITIGNHCYVGTRSEIWSMNLIEIGNRVLIAHDVNIHDGAAHSLDPDQRHDHFKKILTTGHPSAINELPGIQSAPVIIEDDVWISFGVTILKGVTIGRGSVVAAMSVVTHNIPPRTLYRCRITPDMRPLGAVVPPVK
jgi:maltose O-acetyltransferase